MFVCVKQQTKTFNLYTKRNTEMKNYFKLFPLLIVIFSCSKNNDDSTSESLPKLQLSSVSGHVIHEFNYSNNRIEKFSFELEEEHVDKTIHYSLDNTIDFVVNQYTADDQSSYTDTTYVTLQDGKINELSTTKAWGTLQEIIQYDNQNKITHIESIRSLSSTIQHTTLYKFSYSNDNVTQLEITSNFLEKHYLYEFDNNPNPYQQIDPSILLLLSEWEHMNVLSSNNVVKQKEYETNTSSLIGETSYSYTYNAQEYPTNRISTDEEVNYNYISK